MNKKQKPLKDESLCDTELFRLLRGGCINDEECHQVVKEAQRTLWFFKNQETLEDDYLNDWGDAA